MTDKQVVRIRLLYNMMRKDGTRIFSYRDLAKHFEVSHR